MRLGNYLLSLGFSRRVEYAPSFDGPEGDSYPRNVYIGLFNTRQSQCRGRNITIEFTGSPEAIVSDLYEILSSGAIRLQDYEEKEMPHILSNIGDCAVMGLPDEKIKEKMLQTNFQNMTNAEILDFLSQKWDYPVKKFQLLNGQKLVTELLKEGKIVEVLKDKEYRYSVKPVEKKEESGTKKKENDTDV